MASRDVVKVFATDPHSLMAISGAAGPCIEMARILSVELEHYEKIEGEPLELEGKANKLSQMIRANLPAAMQGLAVVPLFAGFDHAPEDRSSLEVRHHRRPLRGGRVRCDGLGRIVRA